MIDSVLAWAHLVLREESTYRDDERGMVANDGRVGRKEGEGGTEKIRSLDRYGGGGNTATAIKACFE